VGHCVDNVAQCACEAGQAGSVTVLVLHSVNECHSGTGVKCCISEGLSATPASHTWHAWQPPGPSGPGAPSAAHMHNILVLHMQHIMARLLSFISLMLFLDAGCDVFA
jgi:hypothetical protein